MPAKFGRISRQQKKEQGSASEGGFGARQRAQLLLAYLRKIDTNTDIDMDIDVAVDVDVYIDIWLH